MTKPKRVELTEKQLEILAQYCQRWEQKGLRTEEMDFLQARDAAIELYKARGFEPPEHFFRARGPAEACTIAEAVLETMKEHGEELGVKFLQDEVERRVARASEEYPKERAREFIFGFQESWLAFYDFAKHELKEDISLVEGLIKIADVCGWWAPYSKFAVFQDRPIRLMLDDQKRLHNDAGPAVEWRDSYKVYFYKGMRVPERIVEKKNEIKPEEALQERNAELRRAMIELMGYDRFLPHMQKEGRAKQINEDKYGKLWHITVPDKPRPLALAEVVNGTPEPEGYFKTYYIPVNPDAPDCHSAIAETYGLTKDEYSNVIRT